MALHINVSVSNHYFSKKHRNPRRLNFLLLGYFVAHLGTMEPPKKAMVILTEYISEIENDLEKILEYIELESETDLIETW